MGFNNCDDDIEFDTPTSLNLSLENLETLEFNLATLSGQKKVLLKFILNERSLDSEMLSKKLTYLKIQNSTGISRKSLGEVIRRLIKTGLVHRYKTETGRLGNVTFKLSNYILENEKLIQH